MHFFPSRAAEVLGELSASEVQAVARFVAKTGAQPCRSAPEAPKRGGGKRREGRGGEEGGEGKRGEGIFFWGGGEDRGSAGFWFWAGEVGRRPRF